MDHKDKPGCQQRFSVYDNCMAKTRGRPKNDPAVNLSQLVTFRLTEAEAEQCAKAAIRAKLSLREWLRDRAAKVAKRESKRD